MTGVATQRKEAGDFPASDISRALPLVCNMPDQVIYDNVRRAVERGYPIIQARAPHEGVAVLVGGGPSLIGDLEDIRSRKEDGAHVFALNGAGLWLQERGIVPDAVIILDARPHNARFVDGLDKSVTLLLATQCDASVFDAAEGHPIIAWHPHLGGKSGVREDRETVLIGGSTTVGMRALRIAHVLGYRTTHLYGYDSSYSAGDAHAYAQPENANDTLREVTVANQRFVSTAWMIRQADDFRLIGYSLLCEGVSLHVHGHGLLPTIAREMGRETRLLEVYYDLSVCPTGYDILSVLAVAEQDRIAKGLDGLKVVFVPGPDEGFRTDETPRNIDQRKQMFWGIGMGLCRCLPSVKSIAVLRSEDELGEISEHKFPADYSSENRTGAYGITFLIAAMRKNNLACFEAPVWLHNQIAKSIKPNTVTITLREASYADGRNSDVGEWLKAAEILKRKGFEIVFVRDTEHAFGDDFHGFPVAHAASYDLGYRLALYENAAVNCFSANGPFTLALTAKNVKAIVFGMERDGPYAMSAKHWALRGVKAGTGEFPNVGDRFKTVWPAETAETIVESVETFLERNPQGYRADYDLSSCPASFDFVTWLIEAEMARKRLHKSAPLRVWFRPGPKNGFRDDHLPERNERLFLDNVLRPSLALVGAVEDDRGAGEHVYSSYTVSPIVEAFNAGEQVALLKAPQSVCDEAQEWLRERGLKRPVVIVLREASHWPDRNSNFLNWKRLAGYLKGSGYDVVIVRDTEKADEPLSSFVTCPRASRDLLFQMALYEQARCVMAKSAPGFIALFTEAPCLIFPVTGMPEYPPSTDAWWRLNHGIGHGEQFPWSRPDQRIIWTGDSYASLRQAWDDFERLTQEKTDGL